jgi:predicted amidohydrolase YtcJ
MKTRLLKRCLVAFAALALALPAFADGKKIKRAEALVLTNGQIHTMDAQRRVVSEVLIENGRIVDAGKNVDRSGRVRVIDLGGRTVIPGIIDAHNHIVLVGNRPGWHTPMEHVFSIPEAIQAYLERSVELDAAGVPRTEFITTIGPIAARQLAEQRLPELPELDAIPRPVYIQAAQGGTRMNSAAIAWFAANNPAVEVNPTTGALIRGPALQTLREKLLTPDSRKRTAFGALQYFTTLGITWTRRASRRCPRWRRACATRSSSLATTGCAPRASASSPAAASPDWSPSVRPAGAGRIIRSTSPVF